MSDRRHGAVFLVGFMGSGKSSVGRHLARELGWRFVDLDDEIERRRGLSVAEIFRTDGEPEFRRLEAAALREVGAGHEVVVATGGGTLTRWENRDFIQRHGVTVWLDAPLEVMLSRCREGERRPLMGSPERMSALLDERLPGYGTADLRVEAATRTPLVIAREIVGLLSARRP